MQEAITVHQLLEESLAIKSILAERFGITLETRLEDPCAFLCGDRRLLRAAPGNLIDDAIKRNHMGDKILICQRTSDSGVIISITGPEDINRGQDPDSIQEVLFGRRTILEADGNGLHLGMALARRIADLHGGRIDTVQDDGHTCSLTMYLPLFRYPAIS
ncbi:MAG: HAMP domain-containing histidine kinase [Actinobacteria bacterium]|nr:HAMP domain-containing histidine kinase [Actinomycetota bacterium]